MKNSHYFPDLKKKDNSTKTLPMFNDEAIIVK